MPLRRWKARVPSAPIVDRDEFLDVLIIFVTLNMGVWLATDGYAGWRIFASAAIFLPMTRLLCESGWALLFLAVGLLHLWGFLREAIETRRLASFLSFLLWLFTWILMIHGNAHSPTTGALVVNWIGSGAIYLRLRREGPADARAHSRSDHGG